MVTTEKLKVFEKYGGDIDGLARIGSEHEKQLFDSNEWATIDILYQDIELITKRLVSHTYIEQTLKRLKENCDKSSFDFLIKKLYFFHDFQKVADILRQVKLKIQHDTDTVWAGVETPVEFIEELNQDIENIEFCEFSALEKIQFYFLPTGKYQEISISNGWGDEFIEFAENFDKVYEALTKK